MAQSLGGACLGSICLPTSFDKDLDELKIRLERFGEVPRLRHCPHVPPEGCVLESCSLMCCR